VLDAFAPFFSVSSPKVEFRDLELVDKHVDVSSLAENRKFRDVGS
jgi:hypothetical protein